MACSCQKAAKKQFRWVPEGSSPDSDDTVVYGTEIEAKAKVLRKGGSYIPETKTG